MSEETKKDLAILDELNRIYDLEFQRWKTIDEKAMHMATSTGTILTLFVGLISLTLGKIIEIHLFYLLLSILLIVIILILFSYSMYNAFDCIKSRPFDIGNPIKFIKRYSGQNMKYFLIEFSDEVAEGIMDNRAIIQEKADIVNCSIRLLWWGIITLVIYIITTFFAIALGWMIFK